MRGMLVSLVARPHGIAPNQLLRWRRLYTEGTLSGAGPIAVARAVPRLGALKSHSRTGRIGVAFCAPLGR
jgi:transposase-like protein